MHRKKQLKNRHEKQHTTQTIDSQPPDAFYNLIYVRIFSFCFGNVKDGNENFLKTKMK